jgi:micrococcal nuclease
VAVVGRRLAPVYVRSYTQLRTVPVPVTVVQGTGTEPATERPTVPGSGEVPARRKADPVKVKKVLANAAVMLEIDGKDTKVRLLGVGPPDMEGPQARRYERIADMFLTQLLKGEFVYVEHDPGLEKTDEDGVLTAYLFRAPDKMFVNLEIVRQGMGMCETDYSFEHSGVFEFYERKAHADGKGLWGLVGEGPRPGGPPAERPDRAP